MSIQVPFLVGAAVVRLGDEQQSPGTVQDWFSVDMGRGPREYVLPVYFPSENVIQHYSFAAARVRLMLVLDYAPEAYAENVVCFPRCRTWRERR